MFAPLMTIDREPHSPVTKKIVISSERSGIQWRNFRMKGSIDSESEWRLRLG